MKKIKLSINSPKDGLLRQTPNNDGIWDNYQFYINEDVDECDFWVVYSKGQKKNEQTLVAPENLIFISGEPEPIYHYAEAFIKKFGLVISFRDDIKHPNIIKSHPAQPWWVGRRILENGNIQFNLSFHDLKKSPRKPKLISAISSDKGMTKGHKDRIKFVNKLKTYFGDKLDVYGKGIHDFEDKWDILKDYKYHIVLENSSFTDYWTEKLADSFLAESYPLYFGCQNIEDYFPKNSLEKIDLYNPSKSIEIIENAINNNFYDTRYQYLTEAKNKVLYEHNIFAMLAKIFDKMDAPTEKKPIRIKHERSYLDAHKIWMLSKRIYYNHFYN